jgi:hypothetical protein
MVAASAVRLVEGWCEMPAIKPNPMFPTVGQKVIGPQVIPPKASPAPIQPNAMFPTVGQKVIGAQVMPPNVGGYGMIGKSFGGMGMKKGGKVSSASKRGDGCCPRGKTKGRMV